VQFGIVALEEGIGSARTQVVSPSVDYCIVATAASTDGLLFINLTFRNFGWGRSAVGVTLGIHSRSFTGMAVNYFHLN
jgi:hypothetical protein